MTRSMRGYCSWNDPTDALCCGTFWLQADFLTLDAQLTEEQVGQAMEVAEDSHDADIGFNWEHLRCAIDAAKGA
ncbi:hypothetical protein HF650_24985 (plasmid) [Kosakonia sp. SMBL-WEM22]|uniref:hypothetical protein n=1 Tax=Kosakonia sp. SMBL-WEM22 TaxID=2725560 RepID=UPI001658EA4D|nr:hypothetical protein [Kosakonia sp. SMBL-WEM22]QNQ23010.1 hypothetical protein HF650_24985 [Kosakonia sp. SMBL-WEM22]